MGKSSVIRKAAAAAVTVAALVGSSPSAADDPVAWGDPKLLDTVNASFAVLAHTCAYDFGYTQMPAPKVAEARDKLRAYLDLRGDGVTQEQNWLSIMDRRNALFDPKGGVVQRATDAMEAAVDDPSTYAQAEQLYVQTMGDAEAEELSACQEVANDPYIGAHYLSGHGTPVMTPESLKKDFADGVASLRAYKAKLFGKRK